MTDLFAAVELLYEAARDQSATVTLGDVKDLWGSYSAVRNGKLTLVSLPKAKAIALLQEAIRMEALMLQLDQDKDNGDDNFAEIKALAASMG